MRCPQREQILLSTRPGEDFAVCCVFAALRACGGGEADLRKEEMMLKMSLGLDIQQSSHTEKIIGQIHDCEIKAMVKQWGAEEPAEFQRECPQVETVL